VGAAGAPAVLAAVADRHAEELAAARWYRDTDAQYAVQPGPYCASTRGRCGSCWSTPG
jgi:hypothetical protein